MPENNEKTGLISSYESGTVLDRVLGRAKRKYQKRLYETQVPSIYPRKFSDFTRRIGDLVTGTKRAEQTDLEDDFGYFADGKGMADKYSEEAWSKFLSQPERQRGLITESQFRPSIGKGDPNAKYYTFTGEGERDNLQNAMRNWVKESKLREAAGQPKVPYPVVTGELASGFPQGTALGNFKLDRGEDERGEFISLYDKYDFNVAGYDVSDLMGDSFEVYDRYYPTPEDEPTPEEIAVFKDQLKQFK
jgi:hypothetical protein